jgi:hypothetical protein
MAEIDSCPPELTRAVLAGLKEQAVEDGVIDDIDTTFGGPVPNHALVNWGDPKLQGTFDKFYDEITGEELPPDLVKEGRAEEIEWVHSIKLYDKVHRSVAAGRGIKPIPVRWINTNKGDAIKYNVRCRLVGKELKAKTKGALLAHQLFSAMPPWEMIKALFSLLVTDDVEPAEELEIGIFDISRAHFMPKVRRELYIELPEEDRLPGEEGMIGRLNRNMYGFRDASAGWFDDWQELLESDGFKIGAANPALFHNQEKKSRGAVHGDDFVVLAPKRFLDGLGDLLKSKYSVREAHRLGFGAHCAREAQILNRIVTLRVEKGSKVVRIEADRRHADIVLRDLGLDGPDVKTLVAPGVKIEPLEDGEIAVACEADKASAYRSCVMRLAYLAMDRADLGEPSKSLAQGMSAPDVRHWEALKRVGRYLAGKRHVVLEYWQQALPKELETIVDSDHAGDRQTRKSTGGLVQCFGAHVLKTSSNLQSAIGLNVSECEYYALCAGACHGLALQAYFRDLGLELKVVVSSDSTSAKSFASRRGLGRQRHVETRYLWLQQRVKFGHVAVRKVATEFNVSDILTKALDAITLWRHMDVMGFVVARPSQLHKTVTTYGGER